MLHDVTYGMSQYHVAMRTPLYQMIADSLRRQIKAGRYSPGVALPSERKLMEVHGVTRATIRHAIAVLREDGIVTIEHGAGTFVQEKPVSPERQALRELYDAVEQYGPGSLRELPQLLRAMAKAREVLSNF